MKNICLPLIILLVSISGQAQVSFEKGYFITLTGVRTDAEIRIKNVDWRDNPKGFEYRTSASAQPVTADVSQIKELGFSDGSVFRRFTVLMDRSTDDLSRLYLMSTNKDRAPEFKSETLFLRLLVDGKAVLYSYDEGNLHRFFFSQDGAQLEQLVYKRYIVVPGPDPAPRAAPPRGGVGINEDYKQQIFNSLKCNDVSKTEIEKLTYKPDPLIKLFTRYNKCMGSEVKSFTVQDKVERPISFNIRPGVTFNTADLKNISLAGGGQVKTSSPGFRIGIEMEVTMPFGSGNVSGFAEAAYQSFSGTEGSTTISYAPIELHLGIRKYFPTGSGRMFLGADVVFSSPQSSEIMVVTTKFGADGNFGYGLAGGYQANRFSAEIYYAFARDITRNNQTYQVKFGGPQFVLGYRLPIKTGTTK